MVMGRLDSQTQKNKIESLSYTIYKKYMVKDLNLRLETKGLLEGNMGSKLLDIGLHNDCFGFETKTKAKNAKINK